MSALPEHRIVTLLAPYLADTSLGEAGVGEDLWGKLSMYLDLLLKWNARTNLTAVREPEEIVRRHFGESLFAGLQLAGRVTDGATLLDFGSGAGFPGLPIQILRPELRVTLAESQGKKASFLREAVRTMGLATEVWAARVEEMPTERRFDVVALRAVDRMQQAMEAARLRVAPGGWLMSISTERADGAECVRIPGSTEGWVALSRLESFGDVVPSGSH